MQRFTKALAAIMLMTAIFIAAGCTKSDDPNNGGNNNGGDGGNSLNGHEYVDLGLPSGTLWATCNVGADTPEGYGDYFAWGETIPKDDLYNWSTYKFSNGDYNRLTKYCNNSEYGYNDFSDNLTTLQPIDDAATVNWGSVWRMPTKEQWEELRDKTTSIWTSSNGVNGWLFTASNGNSLFLPATGSRGVYSIIDVGVEGNYWSISLYSDRPDYAYLFDFYSGGCSIWWLNRLCGLSVRPVCSMR